MSSTTLADDLVLARELVATAAAIALDHLQRDMPPRVKPDGTPVTEADLAVERVLRDRLARVRPDDGILGEEFGEVGSSGRRWILDPIDGTFNFIAGRPEWGTHVALEEAGEIVLGVVSRPIRRATWWASRGHGAFRAEEGAPPRQLRVSRVDSLSQSRISAWSAWSASTPGTPAPDWLIRLVRHGTRVESDLDDVLRVAEGDLEVLIDQSGRAWDHAPLVVIVEEAGGRFSDHTGGRRIDRGEGRFSNGRVHEELLRVLDS
jgi:histidinol-phosphatase